jgi:hypothetical protein
MASQVSTSSTSFHDSLLQCSYDQSVYTANGQLFKASDMITSTSTVAHGCSYNRQELIDYEVMSIDNRAKRKGRKIGTQLDAWLNEGTKEGAWNTFANARFENKSDSSNEVRIACDDILIELKDLTDG